MIAPLAEHEDERLAALRQLSILDTPYEEAYDRITRLAVHLFGVQAALVSLVDERRQWFKSCHNFEAQETGRELSFCAHAILTDEVTVVRDTTKDPRFSDNIMVTNAPGIRFYAGAPLKSPNGYNIGTLCLVDTVPREFSAREESMLKDLAAVITDEFELRAAALVRQQLVEHLDATVKRLTEAEAVRDSLTHMIIHDLRNPVIGVLGLLELVLQQAGDRLHEDERRYLTVSKSSTENLNEMITSLLEVHRLEAGKMPLEFTRCDLRDVVMIATEAERALLDARLCLELPSEPVMAVFDRRLICRVIGNLVGNALKFTKRGQQIVVRLAEGESCVRISVCDEGPGIPPEYQEKIFEKFLQVPGPRHNHSTGLGLSFCKLAVEAHGGKIEVESELNRGTTFTVRLPLRHEIP